MTTVELTARDLQRYTELINRELEARRYLRDELLEIAKEVERLMHEIADRYGVHPKHHVIDWKTGKVVPRAQA